MDLHTSTGSGENTYECQTCGTRTRADHQPVECPDCGGLVQNLAKSRE